MDRRRFLKCAAVGVAVAGSALAGYEFERWQTSLVPPSVSTKTVTKSIARPTLTQTVTITQTVTAGALELELFADWNGDGARQPDEPTITDAVLQLTDGTKTEIVQADSDGKYRLKDLVVGKKYKLSFIKEFLEKAPYRFLSLSNAEFTSIREGYDFVVDSTKLQISLGLMVGPLTLPFRNGTRILDISYHDDNYCPWNPSSNACAKDWKGGKQTYDGHKGTDYSVRRGTPILAAEPGEVMIAQYEEGKDLDPSILLNHG